MMQKDILLEELKNDILQEIGEYKDWDMANYPIVIGEGGYLEAGLIILYNQKQEVKRISQKKFGHFASKISAEFNPKEFNKGTITIYPSGEYESSFIWDEGAYLGKLVEDVESWFSYVGIKAGERVEDKYPELCNIDFNFSMELILSFTNGVSNPALFMKKNQPELTFSLYMEQLVHYIENDYLEAFEEYAKIRKIDSEAVKKDTDYYLMMNEGELKGRYPRWNVARLTVGPQLGFLDFQDVVFEWDESLT